MASAGKTAGGNELPPIKAVKEQILTSELVNSEYKKGHFVWTAHKNDNGYGRMTVRHEGKRWTINAHRAIWSAHNGRWPDPQEDVHHTCGERSCVNPDHLTIVKAKEHTGAYRRPQWRNQYTGR